MTGMSTFENFPASKVKAGHPLKQVNIDSLSSSVTSMEDYNKAVVFVVCNSGIRLLYVMKIQDDIL